jgi:hypothetical protein
MARGDGNPRPNDVANHECHHGTHTPRLRTFKTPELSLVAITNHCSSVRLDRLPDNGAARGITRRCDKRERADNDAV